MSRRRHVRVRRLTVSELRLLATLARVGSFRGPTAQLARLARLSLLRLWYVLDNLQGRGLLTVRRDGESHEVVLTESGRRGWTTAR